MVLGHHGAVAHTVHQTRRGSLRGGPCVPSASPTKDTASLTTSLPRSMQEDIAPSKGSEGTAKVWVQKGGAIYGGRESHRQAEGCCAPWEHRSKVRLWAPNRQPRRKKPSFLDMVLRKKHPNLPRENSDHKRAVR